VSWQKGKLIGKGGYGKVYSGLNTKDGKHIAIKEMELGMLRKRVSTTRQSQSSNKDADFKNQIGEVTNEISLMQSLNHKNIVKFLGSEVDIKNKKLYIFMEKVSGGSIKDMLEMYGPLPESVILKYVKQVLHGLVYLHQCHVIHRDLKCGNLLITTDGVVKLSDFGVSKKFREAVKGVDKLKSQQTNMQTMIGSPYWMAPEVVTQSGYGRKADIWSLGCTIIEMATAKNPWDGLSPMAACFQIGEGESLPIIPTTMSEQARAFILECLQRDPQKRPSAEELLQDKWITSDTSTSAPTSGASETEAS
jgi:serine/threonine protein kinase